MINAIELENFKAFSKPVRIEFAPITLLFGANSVGKSAIISAIDFVHSAVDGPASSGRNIAHQGTTGDVRVRIEFELYTDWMTDKEPDDFDRLEALDLQDIILAPGSVSVVDLGPLSKEAWQQEHSPQVQVAEIPKMEPEPIEPLSAVQQNLAALRNAPIAVFHPHRIMEGGFLGHTTSRLTDRELSACPRELAQLCDELLVRKMGIPNRICSIKDWAREIGEKDWMTIGTLVAKPGRFGEFELDGDFPLGLVELLLAPFVIARWSLNSHVHIGPLRRRVDAGEGFEGWGELHEWYDGSAAWQRLHNSGDLLEDVNRWLINEDKLNMGHTISPSRRYELSISTNQALEDLSDEDLRKLVTDRGHRSHSTFSILDHRSGAVVGPKEVGTGISQVIPIIVAGASYGCSTVIVEQPELHVHPAVQASMGDLFISTLDRGSYGENGQWIVETHSEHLMLRLMRRIRETARGTLEDAEFHLTPKEVAIYYIENREGAVEASRLLIDEDGDFQGGWPKGFFAERATELFS